MIAHVEARVKQTDGSFYIISTGNYPAFPLALNRAYRWISRYPQLLMLPGLMEADATGHPRPTNSLPRQAVLAGSSKRQNPRLSSSMRQSMPAASTATT